MSQIDYNELKNLAKFLRDENMKRIKVAIGEANIELEAPMSESMGSIQPIQSSAPKATTDSTSTKSTQIIPSPMVGTVYLTPEPNSAPFITEGQNIQKGDVVCIIEAMKMFTKIKAQMSGVITKICVQNESPVDFNQTLFEIDEVI